MADPTQRSSCCRGFLLIEVAIAMVILAVLVVPLATGMQSAMDRSARARAQAHDLSACPEGAGAEEAWEWGARVTSVGWQPGPTLSVSSEGRGGAESIVGVWVDGWFLGEQILDGSCGLCVEAYDWSGAAGRELVIRVRQSEGAWGPPWRSVVPEEDEWPADETAGYEAAAGDGETTGDETVVHLPTLANPPAEVLQPDALFEKGPLGLLFLLSSESGDRCDVSLDGELQSWQMEEGRRLDVYF